MEMGNLFQPAPEFIFFIFFKKYIFIQLLCVLCLLRIYAHKTRFDWLALGSLTLGLIALFCNFGFRFFGIYEGSLLDYGNWLIKLQDGAAILILASIPLLFTNFFPNNRWSWIDLIHGAMLGVLATLYWVTVILIE